jgi:hypothetical protein
MWRYSVKIVQYDVSNFSEQCLGWCKGDLVYHVYMILRRMRGILVNNAQKDVREYSK